MKHGSGAGILLGVLVGAIILACVASFVVNRYLHHLKYESHAGLFQGLCQAHGLDSASCRLLKQVVGSAELEAKARVFTEPGFLEKAIRNPRNTSNREKLTELYRQLFDEKTAKSAS